MSDKKLRPKDDVKSKTLAALLTAPTKTDAAILLGISRNSLYQRIERYQLQGYLDEVQQEAVEVLKKGTIKAAENFVKKIDHHDADISMKASGEVLDRVGITKKTDSNPQINIGIQNIIEKQKETYNLDE